MNYDNRKYRADEARREAENITNRYGYNTRTVPYIRHFTEIANALDDMNERDMRKHEMMKREGQQYGYPMYLPYDHYLYAQGSTGTGSQGSQGSSSQSYEGQNYARRGRSSNYTDDSYARGRRSNYDDDMMFARDGRRSNYDDMYARGRRSNYDDSEKDKMADMIEELQDYYMDYMKHKKMYDKSKDPAEKEHMLLELEEFTEYLEDIIEKLMKKANTPEEKKHLESMKQNIQSLK